MSRYIVIIDIPKQTVEVEAQSPDEALRYAVSKSVELPWELVESATFEVRHDDF